MINKLFYIIYNTYYKHGNYKNDIPPLTVFGIFYTAIVSTCFSMITGIAMVNDPIFFNQHLPKIIMPLLLITSVAITYFSFYYKKRYKLIYNKYKDNLNYDSLFSKILAFTIIVILIISPFIIVLIRNKMYFG